MRRPRPIVILALVLLASFAWLFRRALFAGETFVERDLATFHRAAKSLVPRLVHETAGLPQWNPYYSSGQPFAANPQHALFHPTTALLLILPFEWAFRLQVMLPPVVAAAAMLFLLRSLGRSRWAAAFGSLVWGLGGYTLSVTHLMPTALAASVLPAVLAFAHRVARGGGRRDVAGLALTLGLVGLAGEPATLLMTPVLLIPAVGEALVRRPGGWSGALAGRLILGLVLGVGLAAATLLPGAGLAARSARAGGLASVMADIWSMPPVRLAELVSPYVFGRVEMAPWGFWGMRFYPGQSTPFIYSLYPGLLTTALAAAVAAGALLAPGRRRSRPALLWIGAAGFGILLAAGRFLPLWPMLRRLPLVSGLRYPERFMLLALLPLVVVAAHGFDRLLRGHAPTRRAAQAVLLAAFGLAAVAAVFSLLSRPGLWTRLGLPEEVAARMPLLGAQDFVVTVWTALAFLIAVNALSRRWRWAAVGLLVLAAVDLVHAAGRFVRTTPMEEMTRPPSVIQPLLDSPGWGPVFHAAGWVPQGGREFTFVRPPMPAFWGVATVFEPDFDLTELRWSTAATGAFLEVLGAQPRTGFAAARRRGVAAVIRLRRDIRIVEGFIVKPEGADSAVELRFLDTPRPLVYLAPRVEAASGAVGWKGTVLRPGTIVTDTVVIDPADATRVPGQPSAGTVALRHYRPGRIVVDVEVEGPGPGLLAVNQTWDEFWRARVDGAGAAVLRVDVSLMAVVVPPGTHRLELRYADPWIPRGIAVSACALVALAILLRPAPAAA